MRTLAVIFGLAAAVPAFARPLLCDVARSSFPPRTVTGLAYDPETRFAEILTAAGPVKFISLENLFAPNADAIFDLRDCGVFVLRGDREEIQTTFACRDGGRTLQLQLNLGPGRRGGRMYSLLSATDGRGRQESMALENCRPR